MTTTTLTALTYETMPARGETVAFGRFTIVASPDRYFRLYAVRVDGRYLGEVQSLKEVNELIVAN